MNQSFFQLLQGDREGKLAQMRCLMGEVERAAPPSLESPRIPPMIDARKAREAEREKSEQEEIEESIAHRESVSDAQALWEQRTQETARKEAEFRVFPEIFRPLPGFETRSAEMEQARHDFEMEYEKTKRRIQAFDEFFRNP